MVKNSLTDKLRTGLYTGLAAGVLGLTGCGGGNGSSGPIPPAKSLFQTAVLVNFVDIDYCAKLENVSSATRTTYRDGTEIGQKTITESYCEPLEGLTKGNYKFSEKERLRVARLGTMRIWGLKRKIAKAKF